MHFFSILLEQTLAMSENGTMGKTIGTDLVGSLNDVSLKLAGTTLLFVWLFG